MPLLQQQPPRAPKVAGRFSVAAVADPIRPRAPHGGRRRRRSPALARGKSGTLTSEAQTLSASAAASHGAEGNGRAASRALAT